MKVVVDSSTKTFVRFWLVPLGLLVAGFALYSARSALIILGTALFLALALSAPVSRLAKHLPGNSRAGSTAIAFIVVIALLGSFIFLAVPPIVQQTAKFIQTVPALVEGAREQWQGLNHVIVEYNLQSQVEQATNSIQASASGWASSVGSNLVGGIGSVFSFITATILVLVLTFLMLIEGPSWMKKLWGLYDDQERLEHHRSLFQRMHAVVSGYVTGQLTVSGLGGLSAGLFVFILSFFFNVPSNLAIPAAAITFILSLIPMFGATIAGLLIASLLAFNDVGAAIVYIIFFIIYQQIENNYISPTIQSKRLELSALTILASVTVGLYLFGIAGGIISIPIAGCIKVLMNAQLDRMQAHRKKLASTNTKQLAEENA
ncbi:MAG TPA: AI-2E family transporter [Candidatus Saccharibacteria bacterium]|nr:AI-2E family transporter [Candidatus Saccharibacteria bacterium]HRK94227.1 AI-2E family transporter [Candidatus Saccharibacteria bacterium]